MSDKRTRVTREELYESVWQKPMREVAADRGVSDVAIGKICEKLNVPRPGVGYWAKLRHGKAVTKPTLPTVEGGNALYWEFTVRTRTAVAASKLSAEPEFPEIVVPQDLKSLHPLVASHRKKVQKRSASDNPHRYREECLAIVVGKANLERGLKVGDALLRAFDAVGWEVRVTAPKHQLDYYGKDDWKRSKTEVCIEEEWVQIAIEEKFKRSEQLVGTYGRGGHYKYVWKPQGGLALKICNMPYGANARQSWNDTRTQKVETCIRSFLKGLLAAAAEIRAARLEWEERERNQRAAEARRAEQEQRVKYHEQLVVDLDDRLESLRKAQEIGALLVTIEASEEASDWRGWVAWFSSALEKHASRPVREDLVVAARTLAVPGG